MALWRSFSAVLAFWCLVAGTTNAQELSKKQEETYRWLAGREIDITEAIHKQFWRGWSDVEKEEWETTLREGTTNFSRFRIQKRMNWAFAQSQYQSVVAGHPVKSAELNLYRAHFAAVDDEATRGAWLEQFAKEDQRLEPDYLEKWSKDRQKGTRLEDALPADQLLFIVASNLEVSVRRTELLLNPTWPEQEQIWPYPPINFALRWRYPWYISYGGFCSRCDEWHLEQTIGENGRLGIHNYGPGRNPSSDGMNPQTTDVIIPYVVLSSTAEESEWQSLPTTTTTLVLKTMWSREMVLIYRVTRIVKDAKRDRSWLLIASSRESPEHAAELFARLTNAITLN